uniref:Uncharacterized protein n=1 Tax=Arundo donax TaxID=35708 RepID=A0A0A9C542_ARUDO
MVTATPHNCTQLARSFPGPYMNVGLSQDMRLSNSIHRLSKSLPQVCPRSR